MNPPRDENGSVMVEYGLVLALLSFAFMGGMFVIESTTSTSLSYLQNELLSYGLRNGQ
jgi:Flp pilus assembly pilin Flp